MFDAPDRPVMQRARGSAAVALGPGGRLTDLAQAGSAKAFLPRSHTPWPEVVFLNTSGGLTGGDRLDYALRLAPGAVAVAATQTAERVYASAGGTARLDLDFVLGAGAALDWLPQETILFDAAALDRRTRVEMATDARLVWAEMLVLGRAAMGETLARIDLSDRREVWRGGRLALCEPVRLTADALGPRPALTGGARAFAMVLLMAPGAEDALGPVRAVLPDGAAASAWDGRCVVRVAAADGLAMKRAVAAALSVLRRGVPLPRVWQV